jgi:subtilisin family serine protease
MRTLLRLLLAVTFILAGATAALAQQQDAPVATVLGLENPDVIPDRYIVVLKEDSRAWRARAQAVADATARGGVIHYEYSAALNGFAATLPPAVLEVVRRNPHVDYIEADSLAFAIETQSPATWGIDRVDQRDLPLSNSYTYNTTGRGVSAYVLDTGIRFTHTEFGGRAELGYDAIGDGQNGNDCNGHGTHVAGTVGGRTYGVAKEVTLYSVRVLDCGATGTWSQINAGVDWVRANAIKPAVANMSLGCRGGCTNDSTDQAVRNLINSGVQVALAAGNDNIDACRGTPNRVAEGVTVGATTSSDSRSSFSNWGSCIDIMAPGSSITSASYSSDTGSTSMSGTSMAAPHVAGAMALYLQSNPSASPSQVRDHLVNTATTGRLTDLSGSPNRLLYTLGGGAPAPTPTPPPGGDTVFADDFESNQGWTTNPNGSDNATTGQWERGNPEDTNSSGPKQLGTTTSGQNDLVTGRLAGASVGAYDIDGGVTSIRSPRISLPSSGNLTLTFNYYLSHLSNASSADYLRVKIEGTTTSTVFERLGSATNVDAAWQSASVNLNSYAGQAITILIEAADAGSASLVEAAVDDVQITR